MKTIIITVFTIVCFGQLAFCQQGNAGVKINGVTWAIKNVGASSPEDYGSYFTWEEAHNACPSGWRLPTEQELRLLKKAGTKWTTLNGVNGCRFGTETINIFLPAGGLIPSSPSSLPSKGTYGYYRSSTVDETYSDYDIHMSFSEYGVPIGIGGSQKDKLSVRCVKK